MNTEKHSLKSLTDDRAKDKKIKGQIRTVFAAFLERPKTMLEVSVETGVMRASICRYVGNWKKAERIQVYKLGVCPITNHKKVQFLTTDPDLIANSLNLFEDQD